MEHIVEPVKIRLQDVIPLFRTHGGKSRVRMNTRIADDAIEGALRLDILRKSGLGLTSIAHVEGEQARLSSGRLDGALHGFGIRSPVLEIDRNFVALRGEIERNGSTYPPARSRDQDPLSQ